MVAKIMILPRRSWDESFLNENWVKINWKSRFVFGSSNKNLVLVFKITPNSKPILINLDWNQ